ncbi:hypothetical protein IQ06DRAFT_334538 [Phaeosphaeriaceae sp. SRC1lsM3a]|nr:hypothetical protein IQ06DRAFT_334538 [Stagonospora sp. SRC1lsM3a]
MHFVSDHAAVAVVVSIICIVCASITLAFRQYAQGLRGQPFAVDAWFLVAALVVSAGLVGVTIYGATHGGLGWPAKMLLGPVGIKFQKIVYAGQMLWAAAITLVRVALLIFYRRLFPLPNFLLANSIMLGICASWWISNFVATLLTYKWSAASQTSINYPAFLLSNAVINMVLDIATLCLPLAVIRTLHVSLRKKFMVGGIFGIGILCIIASIVRVHYFHKLANTTQKDRSYSETTYYCFIWSVIEPCISMIAACLPACAPLINKDTRGFSVLFNSLISLFQSRGSRADSPSPRSSIMHDGQAENKTTSTHTWRIYGGLGSDLESNISKDDQSSKTSTRS